MKSPSKKRWPVRETVLSLCRQYGVGMEMAKAGDIEGAMKVLRDEDKRLGGEKPGSGQ